MAAEPMRAEDKIRERGDDLLDKLSSRESFDSDLDQKQIEVGKDVVIDRDEYLQVHRDLVNDKNQLQLKNNVLHRRLAEYYKKRKLDHVLKPLDHSVDFELKFQAKLLYYEELKNKLDIEIADINNKVNMVKEKYEGKREEVDSKFNSLTDYETNTGRGLIYSKKGKPISEKTVERYVTLQRQKTEQSCALRLRYFRVRNAVSDLEQVIKNLEEIAPGLYVGHFEQLVVDQQNCSNKVEDIEDELIKNRNKCQSYNQMLAHIREKMHHTDEIIDITECDLGDAEIEYFKARENLANVKTRRDKTRYELQNEYMKAGLLTRKDLLRDYQNALDEVVEMRQKKEMLEATIEKTTHSLREVRRRMIHAKAEGSSDSL